MSAVLDRMRQPAHRWIAARARERRRDHASRRRSDLCAGRDERGGSPSLASAAVRALAARRHRAGCSTRASASGASTPPSSGALPSPTTSGGSASATPAR